MKKYVWIKHRNLNQVHKVRVTDAEVDGCYSYQDGNKKSHLVIEEKAFKTEKEIIERVLYDLEADSFFLKRKLEKINKFEIKEKEATG